MMLLPDGQTLMVDFDSASTAEEVVCDYTVDFTYRKTSNIRCTLLGNKIVDNSDVVGASPVGAAPTTSSFST